jgi:hypothetical protein
VLQFQPEIVTDRMLWDFPSLSSKILGYVTFVATETGALEIVFLVVRVAGMRRSFFSLPNLP